MQSNLMIKTMQHCTKLLEGSITIVMNYSDCIFIQVFFVQSKPEYERQVFESILLVIGLYFFYVFVCCSIKTIQQLTHLQCGYIATGKSHYIVFFFQFFAVLLISLLIFFSLPLN
jgi:hypothetical protein